MQLQIVFHRVGRFKYRARLHLLGQRAARQFQHRHQLGPLGRAQAFDAFQIFSRGVEQACICRQNPVCCPTVPLPFAARLCRQYPCAAISPTVRRRSKRQHRAPAAFRGGGNQRGCFSWTYSFNIAATEKALEKWSEFHTELHTIEATILSV
jgi:hypothetical protein